MENAERIPLKVLYIGSNSGPVQSLESSGLFDVFQINTSIETVNYLQTHKDTDAIIAETKIYFSDGLQIRKLLEEKDLIKKNPYVLISMVDDQDMIMRALAAGIDDYYLYPIDPERIYNRIVYYKYHTEELGISAVEKKVFHDDAKEEYYKTPFIKRVFDITFSGLALLLLSPLMLLVIIAIKLESKGPFYYVSRRVGANYKNFGFLKFRSMRVNADQLLSKDDLAKLNQYAKETIEECPKCAALPEGKFCSEVQYEDKEPVCENLKQLRKDLKATYIKLENDPRITKVGKFIRNTSIDELPQLINIIKGDMSIVGNRPLPEYEAEQLSTDSQKKGGIRHKRFLAAAGLTGLWQVELRGKDGEMSEEERFSLDAKYAENNSFWGDMNLIFRTVKVFIQRGDV